MERVYLQTIRSPFFHLFFKRTSNCSYRVNYIAQFSRTVTTSGKNQFSSKKIKADEKIQEIAKQLEREDAQQQKKLVENKRKQLEGEEFLEEEDLEIRGVPLKGYDIIQYQGEDIIRREGDYEITSDGETEKIKKRIRQKITNKIEYEDALTGEDFETRSEYVKAILKRPDPDENPFLELDGVEAELADFIKSNKELNEAQLTKKVQSELEKKYPLIELFQEYSKNHSSKVSDDDKIIFSIIDDYKKTPPKIWRTLTDENLLPLLEAKHMDEIMKKFSKFDKGLPYVPELFNWMISSGIKPNTRCYHRLISAYISLNQIDSAIEVFDKMQVEGVFPDTITIHKLTNHLNEILNQYIIEDKVEDVRKFIIKMRTHKIYPHKEIYQRVADLYYSHNKFFQFRDILHKSNADNVPLDRINYIRIIDHYLAASDPHSAKQVVDEMAADSVYPPSALCKKVSQALRDANEIQLANELDQDCKFRSDYKFYASQIDAKFAFSSNN